MNTSLLKKDLKLLIPAIGAGIVFIPAGYLIELFFGIDAMVGFLAFMLLALSLTIGASSISAEVERRTITFLIEKPVDLISIWLSKIIAAAVVIFLLHCTYYLICTMSFDEYRTYQNHFMQYHDYFIFIPYMVFAFGLFFSALLDKSIIAAFLAIIVTIMASSFIANSGVLLKKVSPLFIPSEIAILTLSALVLSYWIFSTKFSIIPRKEKIWACALITALLIFIIYLIPFINLALYRLSNPSYGYVFNLFNPPIR